MPIFTAIGTALGLTTAAAFGGGLLATAATAGGLYAAGSAMSGGDKDTPQVGATPQLPDLTPAPTTEQAKATAAEEIAKQKRMRALSGGKTLLSSEAPILTAGGSSNKTLLGS